jgi:hypothetical protein
MVARNPYVAFMVDSLGSEGGEGSDVTDGVAADGAAVAFTVSPFFDWLVLMTSR